MVIGDIDSIPYLCAVTFHPLTSFAFLTRSPPFSPSLHSSTHGTSSRRRDALALCTQKEDTPPMVSTHDRPVLATLGTSDFECDSPVRTAGIRSPLFFDYGMLVTDGGGGRLQSLFETSASPMATRAKLDIMLACWYVSVFFF